MFDCDDGGMEAVRLFTIKELDILDTPNESIYDEIVTHAIDCAQTSIAAISIVADDRQWFKARIGLELQETPRSVSFCDHAIRSSDMLIVDNAAKDDRFALNPLVTGAPFIRFYAGAIGLVPTLAEAQRGLGLSLLKTGHPADSHAALHRYLSLKPDAPDAAMISLLTSKES